MRTKNLLLLVLGGLFTCSLMAQKIEYLYQDKSKPVEQRIEDLMKRMTLIEKIDQLRHIHTDNYEVNGQVDMQKLNEFTKGNSFGCIEGFGLTAEQYLKVMYRVQKFMRDSTRLGIPVIPILDGLHGTVQDGCTIYPQGIALASTFRPEFAEQMGVYIGKEVKAIGGKQVLEPDLDLARELRWGRVEETYGEDPFMVGVMGVAYIKGLHKEHIIPTPRHFVAHGSPTGGLNLSPVAGGMNDLYSLYLQPFERVIKETAPLSIMNCYSSYDNVPVAGSSFFQTDLLRKQLGFKGYVYSDWGAIAMLYYFHHTAANAADAALQAIKAGCDLEAGSSTYENLDSLVKNKILDIKYINNAVKNVLYAKFESGLFDDPLPDTSSYVFQKKIHTAPSIKLARAIADESIVLLKNENNLLPLNATKIKSIAVIGPNADENQFGDYTWSNTRGNGTTPLEGLKSLVGKSIGVHYAKGCELTGLDSTGFLAAEQAASNSDVAVVFVGSRSAALVKPGPPAMSGEGYDLDDLQLPGVQEQLVRAIQRQGKPVVLVLVTGRPFVLSWESKNIPAIAVQWYGGEQEGNAIADMLFGNTNPSGKLPISFPKSTGNLPAYYNYLPSERGFYRSPGTYEKPGRDYVFSKPGALWPFGFGLSYTHFTLSNLILSKHKVLASDSLTVSVSVKNTGNRDGAEVVQLYVRDLVSSIETPVQALKAFKKVFLRKGEEQIVKLRLPINSLSIYNKDFKKVVEPGDFEIEVGTASNDIKFKDKITVVASKSDLRESKTQTNKTPVLVNSNQKNTSNKDIIELTGVVRDVQTGVIAGVTVKSSIGENITDNKGRYKISAKKGETLILSKKGYRTKRIKVDNNRIINTTLVQEGY